MNPILTLIAITLVNMKNAEHVQFHTNVRNVINSAGIAKIGMPQAVMTPYITAVAAEQDIVNKTQASTYTKDLEAADAARTQCFRLIRRKLELVNYVDDSSPLYPLQNIVNIALLGKYSPDVARLAYQEKSANLTGFVQDCRNLLEGEQVETLGIDGDLDDLEEKNQRFMQLYQERIDERAATEVAMTDKLRAATDDAYKLLVVTINGLANLVDPAKDEQIAACRACVDAINQVIKEAKQTLNNRLGKTNDILTINGEEPDVALPVLLLPALDFDVAGRKLDAKKVKLVIIKQVNNEPAHSETVTMADFAKTYGGMVVSKTDDDSGITTLSLTGWVKTAGEQITVADVY